MAEDRVFTGGLLPTVTVDELVAHIEDDDFFRVYGNPVVVKSDGYPDCVVMSIEYYERLHKIIDEAERVEDAFAVMLSTESYGKETQNGQ